MTGLDARRLPSAPAPTSWTKAAPVERLVGTAEAGAEKRAAEEFTKKLISLGYLTGAEASAVDARPPDRAGTETAGHFQNIGAFLRSRGEVKDSVDWFRKALEVNPHSATAWMNLSIALRILSRWDESDEALLHAVKNGYNDPEATVYKRVASYMERVKSDPKAGAQLRSFLRRVVSALPDKTSYRVSLGKVLFEAQDCAGSETVFREVLARKPNDTEALNLLALATWCLGKLGEARGLFQRSLILTPNQPIVQNGLAQLDRGGKIPR